QWLFTTQRRVIFSQSTYCNVTITADSHGKKLIFGRPSPGTTPAAPELLFLSHDKSHMEVQLPTRSFRFTDRAGKTITGQFDAKAIESWLNSDGFTDPRVAERAKDIV